MSNIKLGGVDARATDVLGSVYEYFLEQFALAEGRKGGEFYTPRSVVRLLVEMLRPYNGRVYDPCCGSSGMFVQSVEFIRAHATGNGNGGGAKGDISIYGQESNYTTWRMARMNLAIRGIVGQIEHGDSFHNDRHPDLRADYILANPPFNVSDWGGERLRDDKRWEYGVPPAGNANFAWVQHFLYHLAPRGIAGFVLANGSMSSSQSGEGEIRKNLIEADLVDCIVALPGQLFRSTQIPACLWFLSRGRRNGDRRGEILFVDARKLGHMADRTHRDLSPEDIARVADTYHVWRGDHQESPLPLGEGQGEGYADVPGFCKSATLEEVRKHGHVLTPGRYVGAEPQPDDGEPFTEKMARLVAQWREQQAEAAKLDAAIEGNLGPAGVWRPLVSVVDSLFVTKFREDGSHSPMTLPKYASRFLADIEHSFGPRDRSFTLAGIDLDRTPGRCPRLWYPDSGIAPEDAERRSKHVVIRLGSNALTDPARARWQLAHECFHLLDPWNEKVDGRPANWLGRGACSLVPEQSGPGSRVARRLLCTGRTACETSGG